MNAQTAAEVEAGLNRVHANGLISTLTETLQELKQRMATLLERAEKEKETLTNAEKLEMLAEFGQCYADYWACDAALQQGKEFEAIGSSEDWTIQ